MINESQIKEEKKSTKIKKRKSIKLSKISTIY